jgi:S-formylglutathione hydrolase FrmB
MTTAILSLVLAGSAACAPEVQVSAPRVDAQGFAVHEVRSPYQSGTTRLRVLVPDALAPERRLPVIYVLPVEPADEHRYGDGLTEIKRRDLANKHRAIFVAPTFSHLPWYADHPTDPAIRQETYFVEVVVPVVDKAYPALAEPRGRLLLGFSKSGWGAWSLLLRHPDVFARAAAWDAPLNLDRPGPFGSGAIFGTPENFERYHLARLLRDKARTLGDEPRLIQLGYGNFRPDHRQAHAQLDALALRHVYRDGPERKHDWHSGWVAEAVELLLAPSSPSPGSPPANR